MKKKIAITLGDPSSIGPEIVLKSFLNNKFDPDKFILIGNKASVLANGISFPKEIEFVEIMPEVHNFETGKITKVSGEVSFRSLELACDMANKSEISAIVTAPVSKESINLAGHHFSGQTEILEHFLSRNGEKAEMLFVSKDFRVLLLTRHVPVSKVPSLITFDFVVSKINELSSRLKKHFRINNPNIALCALNPHAGEGGLIGDEEINVLIPAVEKLQTDGINISGPYPADMLFSKAAKAFKEGTQPYDCYVSCFHDQGLCAVKTIDVGNTVNTTIGLSVIRTSPAHGTAFDIAGKGIADCSSMTAAIKLAIELAC